MSAQSAEQPIEDTSIDTEVTALIEDLPEEHNGFERAARRALVRSYLHAPAEIQQVARDADRSTSLGYLRGLFSEGFRAPPADDEV